MEISKSKKAIADAVQKGIEKFNKTGKQQGKSKSDKNLFDNLQYVKKTKKAKIANKK